MKTKYLFPALCLLAACNEAMTESKSGHSAQPPSTADSTIINLDSNGTAPIQLQPRPVVLREKKVIPKEQA